MLVRSTAPGRGARHRRPAPAGRRGAVAALTAVTGAAPLLLTGDNPRAAAALAAEVGIGDVRAGLLPQDKVEAVRALQAQGQRVLLVGDGVNDAPALAAAHTGIAMGRAGSDLALDTADAVIVRDELADRPRRHRALPPRPPRGHRQPGDRRRLHHRTGHLGPRRAPAAALGVAGHEGSTVIVGLNGLRLLRKTAWAGRCAAEQPL